MALLQGAMSDMYRTFFGRVALGRGLMFSTGIEVIQHLLFLRMPCSVNLDSGKTNSFLFQYLSIIRLSSLPRPVFSTLLLPLFPDPEAFRRSATLSFPCIRYPIRTWYTCASTFLALFLLLQVPCHLRKRDMPAKPSPELTVPELNANVPKEVSAWAIITRSISPARSVPEQDSEILRHPKHRDAPWPYDLNAGRTRDQSAALQGQSRHVLCPATYPEVALKCGELYTNAESYRHPYVTSNSKESRSLTLDSVRDMLCKFKSLVSARHTYNSHPRINMGGSSHHSKNMKDRHKLYSSTLFQA